MDTVHLFSVRIFVPRWAVAVSCLINIPYANGLALPAFVYFKQQLEYVGLGFWFCVGANCNYAVYHLFDLSH